MADTRVRPATPADADAVFRLLGILGRPAADPPSERQSRVLAGYLEDRDRAVLVAEHDGIVVGVVSLVVRERLSHETPEAWIPDLCVDPAARRRGIATALVSACRDVARERGCHQLRLETGHQRTEAHRLHPALGFHDAGISYVQPLA